MWCDGIRGDCPGLHSLRALATATMCARVVGLTGMPKSPSWQGGREVPETTQTGLTGTTGCAKQRGIHIPEVLRGYLGTDFLPFVRSEKEIKKENLRSQQPSAITSEPEGMPDRSVSVPTIERMNSVLASYTFLEGEKNKQTGFRGHAWHARRLSRSIAPYTPSPLGVSHLDSRL